MEDGCCLSLGEHLFLEVVVEEVVSTIDHQEEEELYQEEDGFTNQM